MIKRWSTFNENFNFDSFKEDISSKFLEVREFFLDFEDMGIVSYTMVSPGYERGGYISFDPKRGDVNRFLINQSSIIVSTTRIDDPKNNPFEIKRVCIIVDIKLPGEQNEFGSTVIGNEGIRLFDDMLTANSRLIDAGYDVKMDLNSNHGEYKPVKFLVYFTL